MIIYMLLNILGIAVFCAIGVLFSADRKSIRWDSVGITLGVNILLSAFLLLSPIGRTAIEATTNGFRWLVNEAYQGIGFALGDFVPKDLGGTSEGSSMMMVVSALLPILLIVPVFDILTYFKVLPFIIRWIGRGVAFITRRPKFESFYAVEMMFMGNTEALFVSRFQLNKMSPARNLTVAMMAMSSISASIIGAYVSMVPGKYVIAAIPLNILNAVVVSTLLNPVKVSKEEDVIHELTEGEEKKPPFMSFLGDSIIGAGKMVLIITAMVVSFVALASLVDALLSLTTLSWLSLENILGVILFPFAVLLGFDPGQAFELAQFMGTKLVTNEFVVMAQLSPEIAHYSTRFVGVLTIFLTSFANFSTLGMITGTFKGSASDDVNEIVSKQSHRIFLAGILVSLLSAGIAGLFIW
jgi:purine nucleoside transport protein